jgi:hypothetical protein
MLGCGDSPTVTYKLHNESAHQIQVLGFSNRTDIDGKAFYKEADKIFLESNQTHVVSWDTGEGLNTRTYFSVPEVDSIRIVFDDKKLLVLECDLSNTQVCHSIFQAFEASITQEDYEEAIPIE